MDIKSVIPQPNGLSTSIWAVDPTNDARLICFSYSHINELMRDPNNPLEWCAWNGGTLTEAIQYVINL